jgi:dynein heavy chain 1, cytosolic
LLTADSATLEWTDGVFTAILRNILNNVKGESSRRHWIVFDGDVDPEWAENLNSVLDDNKLLTLPTGERLSIPDNVRLMFEVQNLAHATLATVSRCGMVWYSDDVVSNDMICSEHMFRLRHGLLTSPQFSRSVSAPATGPGGEQVAPSSAARSDANVNDAACDAIEEYLKPNGVVMALLDQALDATQGHIMTPSRGRLISSFFSLLSAGVANIARYNEGHQDFPLAPEVVEKYMQKWLLLAVVWGFGGSLTAGGRLAMCDRIRDLTAIPLPSGISRGKLGDGSQAGSIVDYCVDVATGEWRAWQEFVPTVDVPSHAVLQADAVIPTVDTLRHVVRCVLSLSSRRFQ